MTQGWQYRIPKCNKCGKAAVEQVGSLYLCSTCAYINQDSEYYESLCREKWEQLRGAMGAEKAQEWFNATWPDEFPSWAKMLVTISDRLDEANNVKLATD